MPTKDESTTIAPPMTQTAILVAAILLAMLFVAGDRALRIAGVRLAPAALGIAGLLFVAAALMTLDRPRRADGSDTALEARLLPSLIEGGLWAMALAFAVRLVELAG